MIDSHAHLLSDELNAQQIIAGMQNDNLDYIINVGTDVSDSKQGIVLAKNNERIYTTVGIHPEYADTAAEKDLKTIEELAVQPKVVAIGEIGLDYHYGATSKQIEKQKWLFVRQIKLANKLKLPIVIHCRDAADDILQILKANKQYLSNGFCMHCYSEGAKYIKEFLDLGAYISFTGNITYKKSDRSFLNQIPQNKIMIETDCPYLSPEPLRGRVNQPKNVVHTAQKIADCLQISLQQFLLLTTQNSKTFFNIK